MAEELSILIPARSEMFLKNTVEDILKNIEADTDIIATLDGEWANPSLEQHERVNVIYVNKSIGQRAATNLACRLSEAKYVMKIDAHCAFDKGFDRKMIEGFKEVGDEVTMVPVMRNLHAFDWKCYYCGKKWYQDAKPDVCDVCNKGDKLRMKMLWEPRRGTHSTSYCFNNEPRFMYFEDYKHRPEYEEAKKTGFTESMSLQGSSFMLTRERYWDLKICDEELGNWGNQGIEVACKTWLSGGRVLVNHNTWYAHMFRTKEGFSFPWPVSGNDQHRVKKNVRDLFWEHKWDKAIHPVYWLVEKFWPVPGWSAEDLRVLKESEV